MLHPFESGVNYGASYAGEERFYAPLIPQGIFAARLKMLHDSPLIDGVFLLIVNWRWIFMKNFINHEIYLNSW